MFVAEALESVRNRLRVAGKRPGTITTYLEEAEAFLLRFERAEGRPALIGDVNIMNADRYVLSRLEIAERTARHWSPSTRAHHVRQLRAFAGHLAVVCGLPRNPLAGMSAGGRSPRREGDAVSDDELFAVLDTLNPRSPYDVATAGLIGLCYEVGPRTSELFAMNVADFTIASAGDTALGPVVRVSSPAKNGRTRILPLGVRAEDLLVPVIGHRQSGPLFPGRTGRPTSPDAVQSRLVRAGQRAGVVLHPQRLRRTAASWQQAYGASSGHLDIVFGWQPNPADVKSGHYTIPTVQQLIYAHQTRLSPLDRLELRTGLVPRLAT